MSRQGFTISSKPPLQSEGYSSGQRLAGNLTASKNVGHERGVHSRNLNHRKPVPENPSRRVHSTNSKGDQSGDGTRRRRTESRDANWGSQDEDSSDGTGSGNATDGTTRSRRSRSRNPNLRDRPDRDRSQGPRSPSRASTGSMGVEATIRAWEPLGPHENKRYLNFSMRPPEGTVLPESDDNENLTDYGKGAKSRKGPKRYKNSRITDPSEARELLSSEERRRSNDMIAGSKDVAKRASLQEIDKSRISSGMSAEFEGFDDPVVKQAFKREPVGGTTVPPQGADSRIRANRQAPNNGNEIKQNPRRGTLGAETRPQPPPRSDQEPEKWGSYGDPRRRPAEYQRPSTKSNASLASSNTQTGPSNLPKKDVSEHATFDQIVGPAEKEWTKNRKTKKKEKKAEGKKVEGEKVEGERRHSGFKNVFGSWVNKKSKREG